MTRALLRCLDWLGVLLAAALIAAGAFVLCAGLLLYGLGVSMVVSAYKLTGEGQHAH